MRTCRTGHVPFVAPILLIFSATDSLGEQQSVNTSGGFDFVDVAQSAGVDVSMPANAYPRAVAIADYDGDGLSDIFVAVSGRDPEGHSGSPHVGSPSFLFRNCGNGWFSDTTLSAGLMRSDRSSSGAAFGDYDNDGDLDLYVANRGALGPIVSVNELFQNNGDGTFTDVSALAGVDNPGFSYSVFWFDLERDGDLDLYVENLTACCNEGNSTPDSLYQNNGDGTFTDITKDVGLLGTAALGGDGGAVADYDDDGFQDIVKIAVDAPMSRYYMLRNQGGLQLTDEWSTSGLGGVQYSRGLSLGDYDSDGDLDLFVVGRGLFRNNGDSPRTFTDVTSEIGFDFAPYTGRRFGHTWADLNNDGWIDIVAENGQALLAVFLNQGGSGVFTVLDNIEPVLDASVDPKVGLGVLDFDNDGDIDVFLAREGNTFQGGQPQVLYENRLPNVNHYIDITLEGSGNGTPRSANGARIVVQAGDLWQMREIRAGENASGAADYRQHLGLGANAMIDSIVVYWPSGTSQMINDVSADQHIRIIEGVDGWWVITPNIAPPFQSDGDVDAFDFVTLADCLTGPAPSSHRCDCTPANMVPDATVDLRDFVEFQTEYTGE